MSVVSGGKLIDIRINLLIMIFSLIVLKIINISLKFTIKHVTKGETMEIPCCLFQDDAASVRLVFGLGSWERGLRKLFAFSMSELSEFFLIEYSKLVAVWKASESFLSFCRLISGTQ